jgi:MFS family permease
VLFTSIAIFLVCLLVARVEYSVDEALVQIGSALCGAAQSMVWLVVCRAVQGIGGGGIIQMVQITISDVVSLRE